jgi:hypothetical protein
MLKFLLRSENENDTRRTKPQFMMARDRFWNQYPVEVATFEKLLNLSLKSVKRSDSLKKKRLGLK